MECDSAAANRVLCEGIRFPFSLTARFLRFQAAWGTVVRQVRLAAPSGSAINSWPESIRVRAYNKAVRASEW